MIFFNLGYEQTNIYDLKIALCLRSLQSYTLATPKKSKNIRVVGSQQKKTQAHLHRVPGNHFHLNLNIVSQMVC